MLFLKYLLLKMPGELNLQDSFCFPHDHFDKVE